MAEAQPTNIPTSTLEPQALLDAFAQMRARHPDFSALEPIMVYISEALYPNWGKITVLEYCEALFAIARYADFAAPVRDMFFSEALSDAQPDQSVVVM